MPLTLDALLAILGQFGITVATLVGAAWLLFRHFGNKWLISKFDERLEAFKSAQQQEIERLRHRINTAFDWTVKLQGREFEVLSQIWEKLADAYHEILTFTSPMQSYPNLDRMNPQELEHFLSLQDIPDHQKDDIRSSSQKLDIYMGIRFWQYYNLVDQKRLGFDRYFLMNRMFVKEEIKIQINQLSNLMWEAVSEKKYEEEYPNPRENRWEKCETLHNDGQDIIDNISQSIETRFWKSTEL